LRYKFKTKPWPHQVRGFKFVLREMFLTGSAGLQVPMRWGKTKLSIDVAGALHLKYGISRVLAVTTTSGLGVWEKEIPKHCPFPVRVISYDGRIVHDDPNPVITFYVIHHAVLYGRDFDWGESAYEWIPGPNKNIEDFDPEFVIIDESHRIGDPWSMQCKMAYRYGKGTKFRLILTGTMFHRAVEMVFGQFKFMDDSVFGTHVTPFRRMYVKYGGYGNYEIVGYRNLDDFSAKCKTKVFIEEYVAHTEPVVTTTPIRMEECGDTYRTMERESVVTVRGEDIFAPIILTKHLRCQQIAGGWVKTPQGRYLNVGSEKRRAGEDWIRKAGEQHVEKIVIGARFLPELPDIAKAARAAGFDFLALHGGVPRGVERDRRIAAFQEATRPTVFIAQIQAAAEAIDLSAASAMLFWSMPESYLLYSQFRARIEQYKEKRTLLYDHLIMENSRDVVTWFAMQLKQDVARFLMDRPDIVERITAREDDSCYHVNRFQNVQ
jgi:hypothetical protein